MFGNNSRHTCTFWRCTFTETSFRYKTSLLKKIVWYLFWRLNQISLPKIIFVSSFCRVVAAIYDSLMIISCFILLLINKDRFSHFVVFYFHFGFNLVCWYHIFDKTWKKTSVNIFWRVHCYLKISASWRSVLFHSKSRIYIQQNRKINFVFYKTRYILHYFRRMNIFGNFCNLFKNANNLKLIYKPHHLFNDSRPEGRSDQNRGYACHT